MDKKTEKELINLVGGSYEKIAEQFDNTRKKAINNTWKWLLGYCERIKDGDTILDVGCGNGRLNDFFKEKDVHYLGVDTCADLLDLAKKNYPNKDFRKADLLFLGDVNEMNFDYVFCVAVIHHIPGQHLRVAALKQLKNKVRDDGHIVVSVWRMWNQKKFLRLIIKFFLLKLLKKNNMDVGDVLFDWKDPSGQAVSQRYYHAYTKRQLKKEAKKAGLQVEEFYGDKFKYYLVLKKKR